MASPDGTQIIHAEAKGIKSDFYKLGIELSQILIDKGAKDIFIGSMSKNKIKNNIALISTRPYEKNIALFKELKSANVLLLNHPLTEIKPLEDYSKFDLILSNLNNYQHIIFISTNAVNFFC